MGAKGLSLDQDFIVLTYAMNYFSLMCEGNY